MVDTKRGNLHQTICLIDGIIDRNYSGTSWNPSKQDNLGVNLKNGEQQMMEKHFSTIYQDIGSFYTPIFRFFVH